MSLPSVHRGMQMTTKRLTRHPRIVEASKLQYHRQRAQLRSEDDVIEDWLTEDAETEREAFMAWMMDETDTERRAAFDALVKAMVEDDQLH